MNDQELRTYAVRGLTSRLTEIDTERERIVTLLAELTGSTTAAEARARRPLSPESRQRIGEAARQRWAARRATTGDAHTPVVELEPEPEPEVARMLPRRGRAHRSVQTQEPDAAPSLPPMPRLIKKVG